MHVHYALYYCYYYYIYLKMILLGVLLKIQVRMQLQLTLADKKQPHSGYTHNVRNWYVLYSLFYHAYVFYMIPLYAIMHMCSI